MVEKIRGLCKERGTSIKALERELKFGNGTIARWDTSKPSSEKITAVAEYFGISADELLGIKKEAPTVSGEDLKTLDKLNQLSAADRQFVERLIDTYLSQH